MPNIHGLSSFNNSNNNNNNKEDDSDEEDHNNRYVGGVDAKGGGSGLEVEPNPSQPVEGMFHLASAASSSDAPPDRSNNRHIITMYQSGFTVDNGPYRRLDDPANAEFLQSLATGRTPREFGSSSEIQVGLVDKRKEEYNASAEASEEQSFTGAGETIGSGASSEEGSHVIDPSSIDQKEDEDAKDQTSIQIRLLSSKKLVVKISKSATVKQLGMKINASGMAGAEPYVLSAGYPPRILKEMGTTIAEAGLAGASVTQKKAAN